MLFVTINSVNPSNCNSSSIKNCTSTPITFPLEAKILSARIPIKPVLDPP